MKLSTKLILSFSVVIFLVGGIGITSSYINEAVKDQVTEESEQAIDEVELAGEMGLQLYQSLTRTQYLLEEEYRQSLSMNFSRENRTRETQIKGINKSLSRFEKSIQKIRAVVHQEPNTIFNDTTDSSKVLAQLDSLENKFNNYRSLLSQFQDLSLGNYGDGKEFFTVTIEPYFRTNLLPLIEQVRSEIQANHQQEINRLNSELDRVGYFLMLATLGALLIAISITFFLYRSIANPIKKIAKAAHSIGQGNLKERIGYNSNDELGQLSDTFDQMALSLSQTTVSRDYVDSIIEAMADLLVVTDRDYRVTRINSAGAKMLNMDEEEFLGRPVDTIFSTSPSNFFEEHGKGRLTSCNGEILGIQDTKIPVSVSKGIIRDSHGEVGGYVIVASDISSEKKAQQKISESLKEKEVLLAEIHHRVKNNLAVISGLLQMQIWEADNEHAASALQKSQLRVRSIALVHEKLYQSENLSYIQFDRYLRDLLQAISQTYLSEDSDISIKTDLEKIVLNINQAIPCSLLINELLMNSFKYAFKDSEKGEVTVSIKKVDEQVEVNVRDNGRGLDDGDLDSDSLGMSLVETLAKQLDGKIKVKNDNGVWVQIQFSPEDVTESQLPS